MKPRAGDYERDAESGLLLPRHARRGLARVHPQFMCGPAFFGGVENDPYWSSVSSLLHFNGADASTTFTDQKSQTWTVSGAAQIDTAQSKFSGASGLFDATTNTYIETDSSDTVVTTGDITIEFWARAAASHDGTIYDNFNSNSAGHNLLYCNANDSLSWYYNGNSNIGSAAGSFTSVAWHHVACVKQAGSPATFRLFIGGTQAASTTLTQATFGTTDCTLRIGRAHWTARLFNGHVDDFRVTLGVARYTANFTPPTAPFPNS